MLVRRIVDSHTRLFECVFRRGNHPSDHLGVNALLSGYRAILAVARDVKNWTQLILKMKGSPDQPLATRKMLAARDCRESFLAIKQSLFRVYVGHL